MKQEITLPTLILLGGFSWGMVACRPQCEVVDVPSQQRDTLRYYNDVCTVVMPASGVWVVYPDAIDIVGIQSVRRGVDDVYLDVRNRGEPGTGTFENNMHDYRGDSWRTEGLDGFSYTRRFVKHICSSHGGWYGVFECDVILEGDSVKSQSYLAFQEVADRVMSLTIAGRFTTDVEQEQLWEEAFQIIASTQWLTADQSK